MEDVQYWNIKGVNKILEKLCKAVLNLGIKKHSKEHKYQINMRKQKSLGFDPKNINPGCVVDVFELLNSEITSEFLCSIYMMMATALIKVEGIA